MEGHRRDIILSSNDFIPHVVLDKNICVISPKKKGLPTTVVFLPSLILNDHAFVKNRLIYICEKLMDAHNDGGRKVMTALHMDLKMS